MENQVCQTNNTQSLNDGTKGKAQWERHNVMILCEICKKEVADGNRRGGGLKKFSWNIISTKFASQTGLNYTGDQMKNKWDALKKDWKNWRILKRLSTGLGWNPTKKTIDASDDWWEKNIKANPEIAKFRKGGIDLELEDILNELFSGTTAKGDVMWAPSAGRPPRSFFEAPFSQGNSSNQELVYDLTNTEDCVKNINGDQVNTCIDDIDVDEEHPQVNNLQSQKRPNDESRTNQKRKQRLKKNGGAHMLSSKIDSIGEEIKNHTSTMKTRLDRLPPTITEAVEILNSMEEDVPMASELYRFATRLLLNKDKREMFMAMKEYPRRLWYLQAEAKDAADDSFTSMLMHN